MTPALEQYGAYQEAWSYFNRTLFGGKLQPCHLTFSRHRGSQGFFAPHRWTKDGKTIHEIALNPAGLSRPISEVFGTLVHEMVHQWQFDCGRPPRAGYHDMQWASKMEAVGLIPSDTGATGGKKTGQKMTHYIDKDGTFAQAVKVMPKEAVLPWISPEEHENDEKEKKKAAKKVKLTCTGCERSCWVLLMDEDWQLECMECGSELATKDELEDESD